MFFARGANSGGFAAIGFGRAEVSPPKSRRSLSSEASAMEPSPSAQRLKKWRRVSGGKLELSELSPAEVEMLCDSELGWAAIISIKKIGDQYMTLSRQ